MIDRAAYDSHQPTRDRGGDPLDGATERRLSAALAAGDGDAAEALARGCYRRVFVALVKLCGEPDLAADLTQDTFQRAWAAIGKFDGRSLFSTWLYRIAYNTFISSRRRPRLVAALDSEGEADLAAPGAGPQGNLERSERATRLRQAVIALPEPLRLTVTARFWGEISVAEIAELEGVTAVAIRKRLKRAEALLRQAMAEEKR
ncbi:MAG: sigma-70 family RNA polymerase sigma factor [Acidobacteriota bacterium]